MYDDGVSSGKLDDEDDAAGGAQHLRQELAAILYETNVLGFKGPRKMTVVLPGIDERGVRVAVAPASSKDSLVERYKRHDAESLLALMNKQPEWSDETQSYVLNFHGRVTQASVKNFQIIHEADRACIRLMSFFFLVFFFGVFWVVFFFACLCSV